MSDLSPGPVVRITALTRSFEQGGVTIDVLRGVDLTVNPGEIVGLLDPSGSWMGSPLVSSQTSPGVKVVRGAGAVAWREALRFRLRPARQRPRGFRVC